MRIIELNEIRNILRTIVGDGRILIFNGTVKSFRLNDIGIYTTGNTTTIYQCIKSGNYSIPDTNNFIKVGL